MAFPFKKDYRNNIKYRWLNAEPLDDIQEAAMNTIHKTLEECKEMSPELFRKYLISEHSPIRQGILYTKFLEIYSPTSVHFCRHIHTIPFVSTSREDRTGKPRSLDTPVNHDFQGNLQAWIEIARKRLCEKHPHFDTHNFMVSTKVKMMDDSDPYFQVLGESLVPNCVYRMGCPEFIKCGMARNVILPYDKEILFDIPKRYLIYNEYLRDKFFHGGK